MHPLNKLKSVLLACLLGLSGAATAEMIEPLQVPLYDPPAGYEGGCDYAAFYGYNWGYAPLSRMKDRESTSVYVGSTIYIYCSSGTLYAYGEAYQGHLVAGQYF